MRTLDAYKAYEPFAMREAAALFIQFAALRGWDSAITTVRQPCPAAVTGPVTTVPRLAVGSSPVCRRSEVFGDLITARGPHGITLTRISSNMRVESPPILGMNLLQFRD